jgi:hypothetical protein
MMMNSSSEDGSTAKRVKVLLADDHTMFREVSVANPNALALVLSHKLDPELYHQALGAGAVEMLATNAALEEAIAAVRGSATADEEE